MQTWKRTLYLAAMTYLLLGAAAQNKEYQKFLKQHQDHPRTKIRNTDYCDILMNYRNQFGSCKPFNIFIHTSKEQLQGVCGAGGYPYHGTEKRRSRNVYPMTICRLVMVTRTKKCIYYATFSNRKVVLGCNKNKLPVRINETLTMST